jgi:ABC-2 type transport system ATP-binding protein
LISVKNIVKKYDNLVALNDLSVDINENEIFGLVGPNGAGKKTLIHILATLVKPTSGTATVNGYNIIKEPSKVRSSIGIVFQAPSSDDMLTGYENLKLHSLLYGVSSNVREKRISEVLELVGLTDRKDHRVKTYSGGMRRRLEIARGLIHKPRVIFLDEPTLGLDPSSREVMWKYIQRLVNEENISIILTTHYMDEADFLCDRIGIIDRGRIIALDTPLNLKSSLGGEIIKIVSEQHNILDSKDAKAISESGIYNRIEHILKQLDFVNSVQISDEDGYTTIIIYVINARDNLARILKTLEAISVRVKSVDFNSPTLNDVFLKFAGRHITTSEDHAEGGFVERYAQYGNK